MEKSGTFDERSDRLHFLDYWQVITKRKEVIIATFLLIVFVATVFSLILPSTYKGTATIKVESSATGVIALSRIDPIGPDQISIVDIETHKAQLQSSEVLDRVIKGGLKKTVYFCPEHMNQEYDSPTHDWRCPLATCNERLIKKEIDEYPNWVSLNDRWAKSAGKDGRLTIQQTERLLLRNLRIEDRRGTKLIDIGFVSKDKQEAAEIANMVMDVYLQYTDEKAKEKLKTALAGLKAETYDLLYGVRDPDDHSIIIEKGLIELEEGLGEFKKDNRLIVDARTHTLIEWQDFSPLIQEKNQLKARIAYEDITLWKWKELEEKDEEERWAAFSKFAAIQNLKEAIIRQKTELSTALQTLGLEHPTVQAIKGLIVDLKTNLETEIRGIIFNQKLLVESLNEQVNSIDKIMEEAQNRYYAKEKKFFEYKRLLQKVNEKNEIYLTISQREIYEAIKKNIPTVSLTIAEYATAPLYANGPNRFLNIIIGIIAGITVGTGLAYFIEYLDTSIKTIDDIERTLGLQILGTIPQKVRILTEESQNSPAYEAYRILWTNIDFARKENRIQSLLVTSGGVAEGKTTTIVNLAIAIAHSGLNVLVVDSDFRRPRVHRLLGVSNQTGLTDILMRNADPDGVIQRSNVPNLWVVPSGKLPPNAVGLLTSKRLKECVNHFADKYDIVLYDSPPVLGLSDSVVLASLVDRVLLCVEYRKYPKQIALRAKKTLESLGGKIIGAIVNNINVLKEDPTYYSQVYHYFQAPLVQEEEAGESETKDGKKKETKPKGYFEDQDGWQ